jgi:predicted HicB family RNase H-like nuclease
MARPKKEPGELRVDLRMRVPAELKADIEHAAAASKQSITAWMEEAARERLKSQERISG